MLQSRQIEAFRAVMLTGAITAAAATLGITQPAVSRLIRDLETALDLTLFDRRGNLVVPTAQARALLAEVERSFVGLSQIAAFAEDLRSGRGGLLRVAALPAMASGFLPRFVAGFSRERPRLRIMVDGLPSPLIRDRVAAGQLDVGICAFPFQRDALKVTPFHERAVVAMPANHPLSGREVIRPADLQDEPLILLTKFQHGLHPIEVALQSIRRRSWIETPLSTIACVLALEGHGVAIVEPFSASDFVGRGLVLRALEPSLIVGTALIHSNERPLSLAAREFHDAFLAHTLAFLERAEYLRG
jgi:DNA-binding transcriptional LysR family regulator